MMARKGIAMMGTQPRGSRVWGSRRCGLLRRSASASVGHTRTKTNAGLVAVVAVGSLILAGCGGTTGSGTSPTASPAISRDAVASSCATGGGAAGTCVVGDTGPGGGKVFYVLEGNPTGSRYMEAALNTWDGGSGDPAIEWCRNNLYAIHGKFGTLIGTGKANTDLMVASGACTAGAANRVRAYTGGSVSWSLASRDELNQLYTQQATVGGFGEYSYYWSSSQDDAWKDYYAWGRSFNDGDQSSFKKGNELHVRPVRAF